METTTTPPTEPPKAPPKKLPKAIATGKIFEGEFQIDCHILEDETPVISKRGIIRGIGGPDNAHLERYLDSLPSGFNTLTVGQEIEFIPLTGGRAKAYSIEFFVDICSAYADALVHEKLRPDQKHIGIVCSSHLRAFAKGGAIKYCHSELGYKSKQPFAGLVRSIFRDVKGEWECRFNKEFVESFCVLYGHKYEGGRNPYWQAAIIDKFYRIVLTDEEYRILKDKNPNPEFGSNHHQFLIEAAQKKLDEYIQFAIKLVKICRTKDDFWEKFEHICGKGSFQFGLFN